MRYWCHRCLLVVVYFIRIWVWRGNKKIDFGYSWCMCGARWNCLCGCWGGGEGSLPSGIYTAYHIVDFVVVSAALLSFKRTGLVIVHISPQQAIFIAGCGGSGWKRGREKRTDKKSYPLNRKWRRWKSVNINKCVEWILAPPKKSTSVCVCVYLWESEKDWFMHILFCCCCRWPIPLNRFYWTFCDVRRINPIIAAGELYVWLTITMVHIIDRFNSRVATGDNANKSW